METDPLDLLRTVAKLYYVDGLREHEVAEIIGVSRSRISRLLSAARQKGIVRISVDVFEPRNPSLEKELERRFHVVNPVVIKTLGIVSASDARTAVGYLAAPFVSEFVRPHTVIGLGGGRSVAELVRHMEGANESQGIVAVPLMGNIGASASSTDAVELSRTLAQAFGGNHYTFSAPAFAPDIDSRDVFLNHQHVQSVWELFERMQTAFIGIGSVSQSVFVDRGALSLQDLGNLRSVGAVGEICGRFYDRDGKECDTEFRNRVINISLDKLRDIPEVIGVTRGRDRAQAIIAALRGGILKSVIIDEDGARGMLEAATGVGVH